MSIEPTTDSSDLAALRQAFAASESGAQGDCPPAEQFWAAVHGELSANEVRALATHTASCSACAEAWRLALRVGEEAETLPSLEETTTRSTVEEPARVLSMAHRFRRHLAPLAGLAAAAALLLMVALPKEPPAEGPTAEYRQSEESTVRSLLKEDEPQPRDAFLLRWSPLEGARYSLLMTTEALEVIVQVDDLDNPEYLVPEASLASMASGTTLHWQIEASLPDGSRQSSQAFAVRIK